MSAIEVTPGGSAVALICPVGGTATVCTWLDEAELGGIFVPNTDAPPPAECDQFSPFEGCTIYMKAPMGKQERSLENSNMQTCRSVLARLLLCVAGTGAGATILLGAAAQTRDSSSRKGWDTSHCQDSKSAR